MAGDDRTAQPADAAASSSSLPADASETPSEVRTDESGRSTGASVRTEELDEHPLPDDAKAKILERYLARPESGAEAEQDGDGEPGTEREPSLAPGWAQSPGASALSLRHEPEEGYQGPHSTQGGSITEDIYRWAHQNRQARRPRRSSMHLPSTSDLQGTVDMDTLKRPGGFRRSYVVCNAAEQGKPPPRALRSFVDFLMLYGHFAGECLDDLGDDVEASDEEALAEAQDAAARPEGDGAQESSRLLRDHPVPQAIPAYRGYYGKERHGEASVAEAVMMLLKSFVGTGILFLGKAFFNGGLLFSTVVLCVIAMVSLWSFLLLVQVNAKHPVGFGELGGVLYGARMRTAILFSIVFSQLGFVAAYTVFVAENMQSFVLSVTQCRTHVSSGLLIFSMGAVLLPLSLVRRIAKLSSTALVADAFILLGLVYLYYYEGARIIKHGLADVVMFNSDAFPLLIGTAVFTFEGIGLVIPIADSMKEPERFPAALTGVMFGVMILFAAAGALSYAAFGSDVQTVVITNLPRFSRFVQAIQALYSIAILLSVPLQLFPALSILELGLFRRSGKYSLRTKMTKNAFRCLVVVVCMLFAWLGANDLDKFVSLIGSVACVPLCFVYPPLLHLRACATTRRAKVLDITLFVFGVFCVFFAGSQTLVSMFAGGNAPKELVCVPPEGL
ncbi:hypothetical protein MSPP1_002667 [Malassezia sp. CBS 17886]|nr:hypothetical protein MSPP1_002667 [Malassezia sp. CBS 17886]